MNVPYTKFIGSCGKLKRAPIMIVVPQFEALSGGKFLANMPPLKAKRKQHSVSECCSYQSTKSAGSVRACAFC
jgi:hypothetical protein